MKKLKFLLRRSPPTLYEVLEGKIEHAEKRVILYICKHSTSVSSLSELEREIFEAGVSSYNCPKHKQFHVYVWRELTQFANTDRDRLYSLIASEHKKGKLTRKQAGALTQRIQNYVSLEIIAEGKRAIDAQRKLLPLSNNSIRKSLGAIRNPKISSDKVEDSTILEYWRCGRKVKHDTLRIAKLALKQLNNRKGMKPYLCNYCGNYHVGHGGGKSALNLQLKHGRKHWDSRPDVADRFALSKGLISNF
jgi:hypothetical protein